MADEPRRSGRATKGQHTKDREETSTENAGKKKGKGKGSKAKQVETEPEEEEEEEYIRCICGTYEEEEDEPRAMICCDNCSAWQHNGCMGLPEDYEADSYFCEQCKPEQHKDLLAAVARGEKPWEAAIKTAKKKGKKGRKSAVAASQEPEEIATPARGAKRKAETPVAEVKNKKVRGTPAAENGKQATPPTQTVGTPARQPSRSDSTVGLVATEPKELPNQARKNAASSLVSLFSDQIKSAVKKGLYKLDGTNAHDYGLQLGLQVEHGMNVVYPQDSEEHGEAYKQQLRAILFNVKKNTELAVRVMKGDISATMLGKMDPKEFASDEEKRKEAEMKKELDKQHEMIQEEQGPRIRRTHKGEEYVDEANAAADSKGSGASSKNRAANHDADKKMADGKRSRPAVSVNTKSNNDPRRKSSTNFDIDKVWSGVQGSPDAETQRFPEIQQRGSPPPRAQTGADPDIDNLLKDEDNESEPYSPKEFDDEGVVWRGLINGGGLGRFHTFGKFAAGAMPDADTLRMTWEEVIPAEIQIHGRIAPQKADEYLCGLQYSDNHDLIVVTLAEPKSGDDARGFASLFRYFKSKQRYGVGTQHSNPAIKDIYLLPMEAGTPLPTFMKALMNDFPDPVPESMMLVPIVIKNSELPHMMERERARVNAMSPVTPVIAQTPITPQEGRLDGAGSAFGPQSQVTNGGSAPHQQPTPVQAQVGQSQTPQQQQTSTASTPAPVIPPGASTALASAIRVLGPELAAAPAVQQLVVQAPKAGEQEMRVILECIQENQEAANNLTVLTLALQARSKGSQQRASQPPPAQA